MYASKGKSIKMANKTCLSLREYFVQKEKNRYLFKLLTLGHHIQLIHHSKFVQIQVQFIELIFEVMSVL